jgi:hypothetical protein
MKSSLPVPEDLGLNREHYWTYGFASSPSKVSNPINSILANITQPYLNFLARTVNSGKF